MNPLKTVSVEHTETWTGVHTVEVENSKWFSATKYEPGQPGVFEVNPVDEFDVGTDLGDADLHCRRFSFFNGKAFGPIAQSPQAAFDARFGKSALGSTITQFRGLAE